MPVKEGESTLPVSIQTYNTQSETPSMLKGTVAVSSSRFLHVDVNLWYSELAWEALAKTGVIYSHFQSRYQSRYQSRNRNLRSMKHCHWSQLRMGSP